MDELDELLNKRVTPGASPDLAPRIIAATDPQAQKSGAWNWRGFWEQFMPQPTYVLAFACFVVLGVGIYLNIPRSSGVDGTMDDIAMYMVYDTLLELDDFS